MLFLEKGSLFVRRILNLNLKKGTRAVLFSISVFILICMLTSGKITIVSHPPHTAICTSFAANYAQAFLNSGRDPGLKSCVRGPSHTRGCGDQTEAAAGIQRM